MKALLGYVSPAAAGGEAPEPSQALPKGDGGHGNVGQPQKVDLMAARIDKRSNGGANQPTIEDQTTPEVEKLPRVGDVILPVDDDEQNPRAHNCGDEHPEGKIQHLIALPGPFFARPLTLG